MRVEGRREVGRDDQVLDVVQLPSAFAASIIACPAGAISPAASRRATRCLFDRAQPLPRRRGLNHIAVRSSSSERVVLSIHPKHSACSTACSYPTVGRPVRDFHVTSHTPSPRSWCSASQARQASTSSGCTCSLTA
ncbi:hypothetical protein [Actinomycetospora straminea]|uniref:hypothetical protein n=1 Tax=Actinomycetospora straminea TaxID=663607 RepID=UPI0023661B5C|nr:hypothetical protein [Actinomycetospora straminea]MDD7933950.1 hypothetical protein [Actinomycetospora straminea]